MSIHLQKEISHLKKKVLTLSAMVEENLRQSIQAIDNRDAELARQVITFDERIDAMELEIEEDCLKTLALYQPVAVDLRFIIAVLKINNDLERIGDLTTNIAERAEKLSALGPIAIPERIGLLAEKTMAMLKKSIDALIALDAQLSRAVCAMDDEVDQINSEMYRFIKEEIRKSPDQVDALVHLLSVSRQLERIADHTTNISEDVIYMIEGEIIRHRIG